MDVEIGAKYLPISWRSNRLARFVWAFWFGSFVHSFILALALCSTVDATADEDKPLRWSASNTRWDRRQEIVYLSGDGAIHQKDESLYADELQLDLKNRKVTASGNCRYYTSGTLIEAETMNFDLETRTGTIYNAKVSNGAFLIAAKRIEKVGVRRYHAYDARYTTCQDCPGSWVVNGSYIDFEFEGYAFMRNMKFRIKDVPITWIPYAIIPLKTKRQSGLIAPVISGSANDGVILKQPLYLTLGKSADTTLTAGVYTRRGFRGEWEGRYRLSNRSAGVANLYFLTDKTYFLLRDSPNPDEVNRQLIAPRPVRYGLRLEQEQILPYGFVQKVRIYETSDNQYPVDFSQDIPGGREVTLGSEASLSHSTPFLSSWVQVQRIRNLLHSDPAKFDEKTVQVYPAAELTTNDQGLFGGVVTTGMRIGLHNFTRAELQPYDDSPFNDDFDADGNDIDRIYREAVRVELNPRAYVALRPWDRISVVPSAQYRLFYYNFGDEISDLWRGYLQLKTDLSFQIERVYETGDLDVPRVKHLFRPELTYSFIPPSPFQFENSNHPFIRQIGNSANYNYQFDSRDFVPLGRSRNLTNYFIPQGHSVSYGFTTQIIRRLGKIGSIGTYQRLIEFKAHQSLDILELTDRPEAEQVPLSRLRAQLNMNYYGLGWSTTYDYYPDLQRLLPSASGLSFHSISTGFRYLIERSKHEGIFNFERSVNINYTYNKGLNGRGRENNVLSTGLIFSINDYLQPRGSIRYDLAERDFTNVTAGITFQHPSRCWEVGFGASWSINPRVGLVLDTPQFSLNWTGTGFDGLPGS